MQQKNNRNTFSDNLNVQPSTSKSDHQFRPVRSINGMQYSQNSNLVVTQQQQPNRASNNFHLNTSSTNTINPLEAAKRIVAAMQQPQNPSIHLVNNCQSPVQITQNHNPQLLMDRSQIIRLPDSSQTDSASMNDIYKALYLIQQNQLQAAKNKSCQNNAVDACRAVISNSHNQSILSKVAPSLASVSMNSTPMNQNTSVLTMSNSKIQFLEVINRINAQQTGQMNVSLIKSDPNVAQQLLNTLQKQCPRPPGGTNSPGFMVIGQTFNSSNASTNNTKDVNNTLSTSSNSNTNEISNSLILKMPLNSKASIPVWTELLDKLSNNPETLSEINRSNKLRDLDDKQLNVTSQSYSGEISQRNNVITSYKPTTFIASRPLNKSDNHQILRDSKAISYLMTGSNNMSINNDDMIDKHFEESLRDKADNKKSINHQHTINGKSIELTNGNVDHQSQNNKTNALKKSCYSFIDLERPESGITRVSTPNRMMHINHQQQTIKEKADAMVENLLKRTLNSNYSARHNAQLLIDDNSNTEPSLPTNEVKSNNDIYNSTLQSSIEAHTNRGLIGAHTIDTVVTHENINNLQNSISSRPYPSKINLPLKKRIMLDFNENGDANNIPEKGYIDCLKQECKPEMNLPNKEIPNKMPRKRNHSGSMIREGHHEDISHDPVFPIAKKRRGRIPGSGKNQKLKEECRLKEIAKINMSGSEGSWHELLRVVGKPPNSDTIFSKMYSMCDLDSLKVSKEEFVQIGSCNEVAPKLGNCRNCRQNANANSVDSSVNAMDDISSIKSSNNGSNTTSMDAEFCRFHGFRKLQFNSKGLMIQAGFSKSNEADSQELSLWQMYHPSQSELSISQAAYLLKSLNSVFCELVDFENKFLQRNYDSSVNCNSNRSITTKRMQCYSYYTDQKSHANGFVWRRPVRGIRVQCDVCDSAIFNCHWSCRKCGYLICVDCFQERDDNQSANAIRSLSSSNQDHSERENDCSSLGAMKNSVHLNTRGATKNRSCGSQPSWAVCTANRQQQAHNPDQLMIVELIPVKVINELRNRMHTTAKLCHIKLKCLCFTDKSEQDPQLRALKQNSQDSGPPTESMKNTDHVNLHILAGLALKEIDNQDCDPSKSRAMPRPPPVLSPPHHPEMASFRNSANLQTQRSDQYTALLSSINASSHLQILRLNNSQNLQNLVLFQQKWMLGHPVQVSGCQSAINLASWTPETFLQDLESMSAILVDSDTGLSVPKSISKSFWDGFIDLNSRRSPSDRGHHPACLVLKEWPPSEYRTDSFVRRCTDALMNLPLREYCSPNGVFNLISHLPDFFGRLDLEGPRLHTDYGMVRNSQLGTTNLHAEISDIVNVLLSVGPSQDQSIDVEIENYLNEAIIDEHVIQRTKSEQAGALWHVFLAKDAHKLQQFLRDIISERGEAASTDLDPIHGKQFYLNRSLLSRLKEGCNVEPCAIVQFRGDALFIPAGSPYQVRNLHCCVKLSSDFVSPESVSKCVHLAGKSRHQVSLSHHHRHGDGLHLKNVVYHAMKDAVATLIVNSHSFVDDIKEQHCKEVSRCASFTTMESEKESII